MPKNSQEHSRAAYERTEEEQQKINAAIGQVHDASSIAAAPHLELLAEHGEGEYPLQDELNAIVEEEERLVAPLIEKSNQLYRKLEGMRNASRDEALQMEKERFYREELLPEVVQFHSKVDALTEEIERMNSLMYGARGIAIKLEGLLNKGHTTQEEDDEIIEAYEATRELLPRVMQLQHRFVHSADIYGK